MTDGTFLSMVYSPPPQIATLSFWVLNNNYYRVSYWGDAPKPQTWTEWY
jgi:hypothetical protein